MKRILIASALALAAGGQALAADLPPPPPAPRAPATYIPVAPYYNWTGFYIGGNLGAAFTSASFSDTLAKHVHQLEQHHIPGRRPGWHQL